MIIENINIIAIMVVMMQDIDVDVLQAVLSAFDLALDGLLTATIDVSNPDSVIMVFWNMLPIVGSNPWPAETFLMIIAASGAIIGYYRWIA